MCSSIVIASSAPGPRRIPGELRPKRLRVFAVDIELAFADRGVADRYRARWDELAVETRGCRVLSHQKHHLPEARTSSPTLRLRAEVCLQVSPFSPGAAGASVIW
jgi:hypothetical protein